MPTLHEPIDLSGEGRAQGPAPLGGVVARLWSALRAAAWPIAAGLLVFCVYSLGSGLAEGTHGAIIAGLRPVMLMILDGCIMSVGMAAFRGRVDGRDLAIFCLLSLLMDAAGLVSHMLPAVVLWIYNVLANDTAHSFPASEFLIRYPIFAVLIAVLARKVWLGGAHRSLDRVVMLLAAGAMLTTMLLFHTLLVELGLYHEKRVRFSILEAAAQIEDPAARAAFCEGIGAVCIEGDRREPRGAFPADMSPFVVNQAVDILLHPTALLNAKGYEPTYDLAYMTPWQGDFVREGMADVDYLGLVWRDGFRFRVVIDMEWMHMKLRQQVAIASLVAVSHMTWGFGGILLIHLHRARKMRSVKFGPKVPA